MNFAKGNHTYTIEKKEILKYWDIETIIEATPEQALQSANQTLQRPEVMSVRVSDFMSHSGHVYLPQFND